MKQSIILLVTIILLSFVQGSYCFAQDDSEVLIDPVDTIIESGFQEYFDAIPPGKMKNYGFNSLEEKLNVQLGSPLCIYTLPNVDNTLNNISEKLKLEFDKTWLIPVIIDGKCRNFLFLIKDHGKQKIVGMGGANIAKELNEIMEFDYTNHKKDGFLFIYSRGIKLYMKKEPSEIKYYPLGETCDYLSLKINDSLSEKELLNNLARIIN